MGSQGKGAEGEGQGEEGGVGRALVRAVGLTMSVAWCGVTGHFRAERRFQKHPLAMLPTSNSGGTRAPVTLGARGCPSPTGALVGWEAVLHPWDSGASGGMTTFILA